MRLVLGWTLACALGVTIGATAATAGGAELQAGVAVVDVTPPVPYRMCGYFSERLSTGVHDPLQAKALVLGQGREQAALVFCDLIGIPAEVSRRAREKAEQQTGIPRDHILIVGTHTHTGPLFAGGLRQHFHERAVAKHGSDPYEKIDYPAVLVEKLAHAIAQAQAAGQGVSLAAGIAREDKLSFNRRFHMKDGTVGWNPGKLNPNILRPVAPIDPEVPLVYWESASGKPLAAYVNFAMHLDTVGGLQLSADYPYTLARLLSEFKGPEMLAVFTVGTCGDVNHVNVHWANPQKGHGEAARIGTILAAEALKTFERLQPVEATRLAVRTEIVPLALPKIQPGEVEKARQIAARHSAKQGKQPSFLETVNAYKVLDVQARQGKPLEAEVQVIALGRDLAWVGLPGEVFVELGMAIKAASPFERTIVVELANGSIGYVPTKRAYAEGNYEAVSARCAEGSGELLVDASLRLLRQLYAEALPKKADGDNAK